MEIKIAKFELYPAEDPIGYAVGYNIKANNGRGFYMDTIVPIAETLNKIDEEIINLAWESLKEVILQKVTELESKSPLVGSVWNPPVEEPPIEGGEV